MLNKLRLWVKNRQLEQVYKGLDATAVDQEAWKKGLEVYNNELGYGHKFAFNQAILAASPDIFEEEFVEEVVSLENNNNETETETEIATVHPKNDKLLKILKRLIVIMLVLIMIFSAFALVSFLRLSHKKTTPNPIIAPITTPLPNNALATANQVLSDNGWKSEDYKINTVDPLKDQSKTGQGAFTQKGIKTPTEMVAFLKSGTSGANALLAKVIKETKSSKDTVLSDANWIAVQPNVAFKYPGNTGYKNGMIVALGTRSGNANDIFMLFVSPIGKVVAVRGACANPQTIIPKKVIKKLTPKSSNPKDYKKPGDDKKKDSGIGTKPRVPKVKTPPESTPPPVITVVPGNRGIIDTPTKRPGSETGVTAPGAVAIPSPTAGTTPKPIPSPEPSINPGPSDSGINSGDPGNPFK